MAFRPLATAIISPQQVEDQHAHEIAVSDIRKLQEEASFIAANNRKIELDGIKRKNDIRGEIEGLETELRSTRDTVGQTILNLQKSALSARDENQSLEKLKAEILGKIESLNKEIENSRIILQNIMNEIARFSVDKDRLSEEKNNLLDGNKVLFTERLSLISHVDELKNTVQINSSILDKTGKEIIKENTILSDTISKLKKIKDEIDSLNISINTLHSKELDIRKNISNLESEELEFNARMSKRDAEMNERARSLSLLDHEVDRKIKILNRTDEIDAVKSLAIEKGL